MNSLGISRAAVRARLCAISASLEPGSLFLRDLPVDFIWLSKVETSISVQTWRASVSGLIWREIWKLWAGLALILPDETYTKSYFACKVTHALFHGHVGHKHRLIKNLIGSFEAFYCTSDDRKAFCGTLLEIISLWVALAVAHSLLACGSTDLSCVINTNSPKKATVLQKGINLSICTTSFSRFRVQWGFDGGLIAQVWSTESSVEDPRSVIWKFKWQFTPPQWLYWTSIGTKPHSL